MEDVENHEEQTELRELIISKTRPTQPWIFLKPHGIFELGEVPRGAVCFVHVLPQ